MPDAFSDLTLQLSRALSGLDAARRDRLAEIDRESQAAMRRVGAARAAYERFDAADAVARQAYDQAIQEAQTAYAAADRSAAHARSDELTSVERKYIASGRTSDEERRAELMKAEAIYEARLEEIAKTVSLDKQFAAREAAYEAYKNACAAVEIAARERLQKNRDTQQNDLRAALDRERTAVMKGAAARDARIDAAVRTRDAAMQKAQDALAGALDTISELSAAQAEYRHRRQEIEERYRADQEALMADFRAKRKAIDEAP